MLIAAAATKATQVLLNVLQDFAVATAVCMDELGTTANVNIQRPAFNRSTSRKSLSLQKTPTDQVKVPGYVGLALRSVAVR